MSTNHKSRTPHTLVNTCLVPSRKKTATSSSQAGIEPRRDGCTTTDTAAALQAHLSPELICPLMIMMGNFSRFFTWQAMSVITKIHYLDWITQITQDFSWWFHYLVEASANPNFNKTSFISNYNYINNLVMKIFIFKERSMVQRSIINYNGENQQFRDENVYFVRKGQRFKGPSTLMVKISNFLRKDQ